MAHCRLRVALSRGTLAFLQPDEHRQGSCVGCESASLVEPLRLAERVALRSGIPITGSRAQTRQELRTAQAT